MSSDRVPSIAPYLMWVYGGSPTGRLDAATWLETSSELHKLGWRVTLVAAGPASQQCIRGVDVLCTPKSQVYLLRQVVFHVGLLRLLARERATVDVVLFHQMAAPWVLPLRFIRRLASRHFPLLVMDTRDLPPIDGDFKTRLRNSFYRLAHWLANRWADGQTAITPRMAELVRIPSRQLWGTWPSGVDPDRFVPARVTRRWHVAGEPIRLIYIGALLHERNLQPMCYAVDKANDEGMAYILTLIGDGPERSALEEIASRTAGRIRVLPPVPHDQIPELLAQAHVGVTSLPPPDDVKFQASSPIKLFEYMAAGLPVLATRIACHTDVVGGGDYVFWADEADVEGLLNALRLAWQQRDSLSELGREAAVRAQSWTWRASAQKLKAALEYGLHVSNGGSVDGNSRCQWTP